MIFRSAVSLPIIMIRGVRPCHMPVKLTGGERHHQLITLGSLGTWLWYDVILQLLERLLEAGELHHGVWNLGATLRQVRILVAQHVGVQELNI